MTGQTPDLLSFRDHYPNSPGYRQRDTSMEAAALVTDIDAINARILDALAVQPMTDYELAEFLGETHRRVQPRRSTMTAAGKIIDSGTRRKSPFNRYAIAWGLNNAN